MVKFGVNYAAHINLDQSAYVNYDLLKRKVHEYEDELNSGLWEDVIDVSTLDTHGTFMLLLEEELDRVEQLFLTSMDNLRNEYADVLRLEKMIQMTKESKKLTKNTSVDAQKKIKAKVKREEESLKRATTSLYHKTVNLETSRILNKTAMIKIIKKHDKVTKRVGQETLFEQHMTMINRYSFGNGESLQGLQRNLEAVYKDAFCDGLLEEAQGKLRLSKGGTNESQRNWISFKGGVLAAICVWTLFQLIFSPAVTITYLTMEDPSIFVYAVVAGLLTFRWIWTFAVFMWERVQIDYILMLDLDAAKHAQTAEQISSDAFTYTILFMGNFLIFHCVRMLDLYVNPANRFAGLLTWLSQHVYVMPMSLLVGTALALLRSYLQPTSYGVFATHVFIELFQIPFTDVQLRHTFAADILSSFTKVMGAAAYSVCYFTSRAFLQAGDSVSNYGTARFATCNNPTMHGLVVMLYVLPLIMRVTQNIRQQYDSFQRSKIAQITMHAKSLHAKSIHAKNLHRKSMEDTGPNSPSTSAYAAAAAAAVAAAASAAVLAREAEQRPGYKRPSAKVIPEHAAISEGQEGEEEESGEEGDGHANDGGDQKEDEEEDDDANRHVQINAAGPETDTVRCFEGDGVDDDTDPDEEPQHHYQHKADKLDHLDALESGQSGSLGSCKDRSEHNGDKKTSGLFLRRSGAVSGGGSASAAAAATGAGAGADAAYGTYATAGAIRNSTADGTTIYSSAIDLESRAAGTGKAITSAAEQNAMLNSIIASKPTASASRLGRLSRSESFQIAQPKIKLAAVNNYMNSPPPTTFVGKLSHWWRSHVPQLPRWLIVWPYTYNMLRYILSILVVVFGAFPPVDPLSAVYMAWYIPLVVMSTVYNIYWDISVDWKLFSLDMVLLRDESMMFFGDMKSFYYIVMVLDVIFRCMWTLVFTPYGGHPFLGVFELVRRGLWACLRMEIAYLQELQTRSKLA